MIVNKVKNNFSAKKNLDDLKSARRREILFCSCCVALPLLQFFVFYIYVSISGFALAFQRFDSASQNYVFYAFNNFKTAFEEIAMKGNLYKAIGTSLKVYLLGLLVEPLTLFFPYYVYKKMPGSEFFKVMLYLPSILSSMVVGLIFQYVVDQVIPGLARTYFQKEVSGFLSNIDTRFWAAWAFSVFIGVGGSVLLYSSAMSRIPESLVESANLEGCGMFKEFIYITFPLIFPTFATFFVTGTAAIFTNQLNLYVFFGDASIGSVQTVGYYVFCMILGTNAQASYPYAAAIGLLFTVVIAPLTLLLRYVTNKISPDAQF